MPAPATTDDFLSLLRQSELLGEQALADFLLRLGQPAGPPADLAREMIEAGLLTPLQANLLLRGKWRGFQIGKYRLLERIGGGGMGLVYLCEHSVMRRLVALKILASSSQADDSLILRFHREARVVAALDHPNIVRAYDVDQDDHLHFLVLEYVDGSSLQDIVAQHGPLSPERTVDYLAQAACGLGHAHEAGIVHRDIKPGNILLDRLGVVKILDMGLARLSRDPQDNITAQYDNNFVLGTVDYLAPEQASNSHTVDARVDLYSLGCTGYYLLTGQPPFPDGSVGEKIVCHQVRSPTPLRALRPEVPEGLVAILNRLMAKDPARRYQSADELLVALAQWQREPVGPPPEEEMPRQCPAVRNMLQSRADSGGPHSSQRRVQLTAAAVEARASPSSGGGGSARRSAPARSSAIAVGRNGTAGDSKTRPGGPDGSTAITDRKRRAAASGAAVARRRPRPSWLTRALVVGVAVSLAAAAGLGVAWWRWSGSGTPAEFKGSALITPEQAPQYLERYCTVEMVVRSVGYGKSKPVVFLNSEADYQSPTNFVAYITETGVQGFKQRNVTDFEAHFKDKKIRVTGTVVRYGSVLEIKVTEAYSIVVLDP
jgi:serine/threonine protein kinase